VGGIVCDPEKAFDCVNHDLSIKKLNFYGILGNAYALINSYLSDRHQVFTDDNLHILILLQNGVRLNTGCHRDLYLDQ
jgi:hypothetical protein